MKTIRWVCRHCGNFYKTQHPKGEEIEQPPFCSCGKRDFKIDLKNSELLEEEVTLENIKINILTLIAIRKKHEATEKIVETILEKEQIYTTRSDEKSEMWIYEEGIYIPQAKTYIKEYCRKLLGDVYTTTLGNEVITKIEADTYIEQENFFTNENIDEVAIENGILNIITKELTKFTPHKRFFNKHPIKYDPTAECPAITKHFKEVLKFEEDLPVIEEIFGYLLFREYKLEKAFMLLGTGRNGKGKTLELMKKFIGIDNCSSIPLQQLETDNFSMGELFNKMANIAGDLDRKALTHTGAFKTLTGRDLISASRKFLTRVKFTNYAKLIFACNELPITYDLTHAFWSRWIVLEFPYTFVSKEELEELEPEEKKTAKIKDSDIIKKIATPEELSGLLNKALLGLERILKKGEFSYSKNTEEVKKLWLRKSSSFNAFIMDHIKEDWESRVEKTELKKEYAFYCRKHKLRSIGDKGIKAILATNFGVTDERDTIDGNQRYMWVGIKLLENKEEENTGLVRVVREVRVSHSKREKEINDQGKKTIVSLTTQTNKPETTIKNDIKAEKSDIIEIKPETTFILEKKPKTSLDWRPISKEG